MFFKTYFKFIFNNNYLTKYIISIPAIKMKDNLTQLVLKIGE